MRKWSKHTITFLKINKQFKNLKSKEIQSFLYILHSYLPDVLIQLLYYLYSGPSF